MKRLSLLVHRISMALFACLLLTLYSVPVQAASAKSQDVNTSYVRVIHASPFVGTADVFVDGTKLLSSFQFASVTDYVPVPQGAHKVQIALLGKGIDAALITQTLQIQAGFSYTVAALGATPKTLSLQVFVDNNQVVPNRAKVRIYHLSPDGGSVNVTLDADTSINNVAYPDASDYVNMDKAGSYTFNLNDPQYNTNLPTTTTLSLNTVTSVFAVGLFSGNPKIQLVTAETAGVPGLPGTGSNPLFHPIDSVTSQPFLLWLLAAGVCVLLVPRFVSLARRSKRIGKIS